jgi:hypothetical protein
MSGIRSERRTVRAVLALAVAVVLAVPLLGAAGGNASNAKACQNGGYSLRAPSTDPYTAFADEGACVSHGARGGTIVPHVALSGSIRLVPEADTIFCTAEASVTGVADDARVQYDLRFSTNGFITEATAYASGGQSAVIEFLTLDTAVVAATAFVLPDGPLIPLAFDTSPCGG